MDLQIQAYLRAIASQRRDAERVGPFLAAFDPTSDNLYRNYALPDDGAEPTPADVQALITAFERRRRTPRLEYVPAAAPAVEASLLDIGFLIEGRLPLMVVSPTTLREAPVPSRVEIILPSSDGDLLGTATVQGIAYDEPTVTEEDVARLRRTLAAGGIVVLARDAATGEPVGGGLCSAPHAGVTEIAGIGVIPEYRRHGIAAALCARLAQEAFAAGITMPFLMPAGEAEERIYARIGFVRAGEILHISRQWQRGNEQ